MMLIQITEEVNLPFGINVQLMNLSFFSAITYEALTNQLTKHGGLLENLSIRYVA